MTRMFTALCMALVGSLPAAEEVELPCDWAKGTIRVYDLVREKENTRDGKTNVGRTRVPLTIEVVDRTAQGYQIAWSYGTTQVIEPKDVDESQARLLRVTDGLRFLLRTDTAATPEELLNTAAVTETYRRALGEIRKTLETSGMAADVIAQVTAPVEALTQPERVPAIALKEPNLFFLVTGGSFVPGQPRGYEDELVNPLTGKPLGTSAQMLLKPRQAGAPFVVEWSQKPSEPAAGGLDLQDSATYTMNPETGWPTSVRFERSITAGTTRRVERLVFTAAGK